MEWVITNNLFLIQSVKPQLEMNNQMSIAKAVNVLISDR